MERHLHIVCFDIPYPVDHGGFFDLFYKIIALKNEGISVHLHCFEHLRQRQEKLSEYCASVSYYKRQVGYKGFSFRLPYIVSSRNNKALIETLLEDNYPILLEGIHCSFLLQDDRFRDRKIVLRSHNVEHEYYRRLAKTTQHLLKKIYYLFESRLLKKYEKLIVNRLPILSVSQSDVEYYRSKLGAEKVSYLPVFTGFDKVESQLGLGPYCLYHGNLSIAENEQAAFWLLKKVFNDINIPFVIAGRNPSEKLKHFAEKQPNTCLVANPVWEEMQEMIHKAQINIIPSFNSTGIKLKLLNVLFNGRHCIVNEACVKGSGLEPACYRAESPADIKSLIVQLYNKPFTEEEIKIRETLLGTAFDNQSNARKLLTWLY